LFDREPFLRPDRNSKARRAQLRSRIAPATAERRAEGVLDGSEHGAILTRSGGNNAGNKKNTLRRQRVVFKTFTRRN
jgi:hypothetical protein